MLTPQPTLLDGLFNPPQAQQVASPVPGIVDGGYDWGQRRFPGQPVNPLPGQAGHHFVPGQPNPAQPIMSPHNPVPTNAPSLSQMRQMMTQLHMQQMVNRLQKHVNIHAGR